MHSSLSIRQSDSSSRVSGSGHDFSDHESANFQHFKGVLSRFLSPDPGNKNQPRLQPKDLSNGLLRASNQEKLMFLDEALQAGINNNHDQNPNTNRHMALVSWSLEQLASLPSAGAMHNSIDKLDLSRASNRMLRHFDFARRFLTLYPPVVAGANSADQSASAASKNLRMALVQLLRNPCAQSRDIAEHAINDKGLSDSNPDLQRAKLLLSPNSQSVKSIKNLKQITDPVFKQILKEIPYPVNQGENLKINYNARVFFEVKGNKEIVCRHLATHRIETQAMHSQGKFRLQLNDSLHSFFPSTDALAKGVKEDVELKFDRIGSNAIESHFMNNADFGKTLIAQFKVMRSNMQNAVGQEAKQKESVRFGLLLSLSHAMSLLLHIKPGKQGETQYVVEFYDPNKTLNHVRTAHTELNALHRLGLKDFFSHPAYRKLYHAYFPESQEQSVLHITGNSEQTHEVLYASEIPAVGSRSRKESFDVENTSITPAVLWHLLSQGFSQTLTELTPKIQKSIVDGQFDLNDANIPEVKAPAIFLAMKNGHASTIQAFGKLLQAMPEQKRASVLAVTSGSGMTPLGAAMHFNKAAAIEAFGSLLELVPQQERADLLNIKDSVSRTAIYHGISEPGREAAIKAFVPLFKLVPENQRASVLSAENRLGTQLLCEALQRGNAFMISVLGMLLEYVPEHQRASLLGAKNGSGVPGLFLALQRGHLDAVEQFGNLLQKVSKNERLQLLTAKDERGYLYSRHALRADNPQAAVLFSKLLATAR